MNAQLLPATGPVITRITIETLSDTLTVEVAPTADYGNLNNIIDWSLSRMADEERRCIEAGDFAPLPEEELRRHYDRIQAESKQDGRAPERWRELCRVKRGNLNAEPVSAQNAGQSEPFGIVGLNVEKQAADNKRFVAALRDMP
jgi:hypothetical protein